MRVTLKTDSKHLEQAIDLVIEDFRDLSPILKKFAKHKRKKVQAIFDQQGPGWQPLKQSTTEVMAGRLKRRAQQSLRGKLRRDVRRAEKRYAGGIGKGKLSTLQTRKEVLSEFERIVKGGTAEESSLDAKKLQKLQGRIKRSFDRAEAKSGQLLGRMASSIATEMRDTGFSIVSKISWARVHNDGGTAGHGAQIPARPFLEWTSDDAKEFVEIAKDHIAKKWEEG